MRSAGKQERGQSRSYESRIKNASTSSVDKSVHDERCTSFLRFPAVTADLIAYFVGIGSSDPATTIYRGKHFVENQRVLLVTDRAFYMVHPWGKLRSPGPDVKRLSTHLSPVFIS